MRSRPDLVESSRTVRSSDGSFYASVAQTEYSLAMGSDRYYAADKVTHYVRAATHRDAICIPDHPSGR
jgi:hypothetical protein